LIWKDEEVSVADLAEEEDLTEVEEEASAAEEAATEAEEEASVTEAEEAASTEEVVEAVEAEAEPAEEQRPRPLWNPIDTKESSSLREERRTSCSP
jgi:hypothetical protein